jgi:hypothetical protein
LDLEAVIGEHRGMSNDGASQCNFILLIHSAVFLFPAQMFGVLDFCGRRHFDHPGQCPCAALYCAMVCQGFGDFFIIERQEKLL